MFSPAIYSLKSTLFQVRLSVLFDTQPSKPTRHRKRLAKSKIHGPDLFCSSLNHSSFLTDSSSSVKLEAQFVESNGLCSETLLPSQLRYLCEENGSCSDTLATNQLTESYVLGYLLQSCCNVKELRKVHAMAVKCAKESNFYVENNLISMYVKLGYLAEAQRVFDNMLERNVVSWTAMINGYMRFGLYKEAMRLLAEFVHEGFQWNSKTFVCVLNLIARRFDFELGKQVHACVLKSGFKGLILESSILHFYSQCGDLEGAFRVFDKMKERDVVSWTTLITACSQHGQGKKALILFSTMVSDGFDANEFTVCSVLNACGDEKELRFGTQLLGAIVKRIYKMDVFVRTSIVDMFAKCGQIANARKIFDGTRKRNIVTWTSIIAGYARNGLAEEAISLFRIMTRRKIFANNLTMVSVLRACGLLRALQTGKEVHARIIKNFPQSNIYIGSSLVWLYCKCGENSMANKVLQGMPFRDVVSWTAMISGCAHLGHEHEALEYLKKMLGEGVVPNSFTYSSALKACTKLEDIGRGKLIHSSINKTPAISNVFVGSALINMYAKCGHLPEAIQVFDSMPERNLVSWKAMVIAYAKHGFCGEALKLLYRMQAEDIEVDDYILLTVLTACGDFEESVELATDCHLDMNKSSLNSC
ncbi:pentatricopeptide repeat-containing protein At4g18520, chloroplastic-like [Ipomoea triloba]|uniref:pentatricopeptide repeat-containing protein At4g18520, chloroplastic-like n=1 Tax=Ipomoea triloba TaxID=35885 RepID=UPI00125DAA21|nr:pentatricopeptide repeat-containing protein At4g18520, chloroplastic-like [Ipomoea triloba]